MWFAASLRLWKTYGARVAMQNDVNGFPWGLLPKLREHGIDAVWMGCNSDTSVPLTPTPDAWWWEGPDGKRMLVWSGTHYCFGFELFHASEWRRGPVPSANDVWYNPPSPGETWKISNEDLDASERILREKLAKMEHYKFPVVAFQVTNHWRMDNDPPSRQIADFVKAWNAGQRHAEASDVDTKPIPGPVAGDVRWRDCYGPPRRLARLVERRHLHRAGVARCESAGEADTWRLSWCGCRVGLWQVASLPDAPHIGNSRHEYDEAWRNAILFDEHTWGSYNSIAQPYHPRSAGGFAEKAVFAYRAAERAKLARKAIFRADDDYCDFSRTRYVRVLNPGTTVRSGWVVIPATAIRFPANFTRELATREILPLEDLREPEWSKPDLTSAPYDRPNDVWAWHVKQRRFFLANLPPGETRDFELIDAKDHRDQPTTKRGLHVAWDEPRGRIASLRTEDGTELIDSTAPYGLGQIVVETLKDSGQRYVLANRDQTLLAEQFRDEPVKLLESALERSYYRVSLATAWEHPLVHRVEQRFCVLNFAPRAELTTIIWTREACRSVRFVYGFPAFGVPRPTSFTIRSATRRFLAATTCRAHAPRPSVTTQG